MRLYSGGEATDILKKTYYLFIYEYYFLNPGAKVSERSYVSYGYSRSITQITKDVI
jgi:hypothetical protein